MNRLEALKRWGGSNERKGRIKEGTTYREQKGRVETKEVANGITKSWSARKEATNGREELQQKDGRNEMDELKGKAEQEEQDRRFERKDGPNEMSAFNLNERKRWMNKMKQCGGSNERSRS